MSEININELRSVSQQNAEVLVDPNLKEPKNTAGDNIVSARDLGLPVKEKDVDAPTEIEKGLSMIDACFERKIDEVNRFNDALEENGGEISELEWRAMNGEASTSVLLDGISQDIAESGDVDKLVSETITETAQPTNVHQDDINDEYLDLEKELDEYSEHIDNEPEDISYNTSTSQELNVTETVDEYKPSYAESGRVDISMEIKSGDIDTIDKEIDTILQGDSNNASNVDISDDFESKIKEKVRQKMRSNIIPISSYKIISSKPVTVNSIMDSYSKSHNTADTFKWILYHTGSTFTMRKFKSDELDELAANVKDIKNARKVFLSIYEHIVDGAGADFVTWCKNINRLDIGDLWMGVYGGSFQHANYLPYDCSECGEVMIADNIPVHRMVKFKNDDVKKIFYDIMQQTPENPDFGSKHAGAIVPICRELAVQVKEPSIYDMIIEQSMFDESFAKKYADIIQLLPFIENIYAIDPETQALRLIATKEIPNNEIKSLKLKVLVWAKIIRSLYSDDKGLLIDTVTSLDSDKVDDISYCLPETVCDSCGAVIKEQSMGAADMVFIRHRLTLFGIA